MRNNESSTTNKVLPLVTDLSYDLMTNGSGLNEFPPFNATLYELQALLAHWETEWLDTQLVIFERRGRGEDYQCLIPRWRYAIDRILTIARLVGDEFVDCATSRAWFDLEDRLDVRTLVEFFRSTTLPRTVAQKRAFVREVDGEEPQSAGQSEGRSKHKIVDNEDNQGLQPLVGGGSRIGYVDEVNGAGADEMPAFVPTRHELTELLKYWEQVWVDNQFFMCWTQHSGGTERRQTAFADRRIGRIADVLGEDTTQAITYDVREKFGRTCDRRIWNCFRKGVSLPARVAEKLGTGQKLEEADWSLNDESELHDEDVSS
jgi:hypothetical protein